MISNRSHSRRFSATLLAGGREVVRSRRVAAQSRAAWGWWNVVRVMIGSGSGWLSRVVAAFALGLIAIYRAVISPLKRTPTCRYLPTCSEYAQGAIQSRGPVVGTALALWRIVRCNPLSRGGYDPVPCSHGEKAHARSR